VEEQPGGEAIPDGPEVFAVAALPSAADLTKEFQFCPTAGPRWVCPTVAPSPSLTP
jgi:hypothetical protein